MYTILEYPYLWDSIPKQVFQASRMLKTSLWVLSEKPLVHVMLFKISFKLFSFFH